LELFASASRSSRTGFDGAFLAEPLPALTGLHELGAFVASSLDAFVFGSPVSPDYAEHVAYPLLLPLWTLLASAAAVLLPWKRFWPTYAFVLTLLLLTLWQDGYLFVARYLGAGLSRFVPLHAAHLPLVLLGALAADRVLRGTRLGWARTALCAGVPGLLG